MSSIAKYGKKGKKLLYLINSCIKRGVSKTSEDLCWPPLGVISIGTAVKNNLSISKNWDVKVIDAEQMGIDNVLLNIKKDKPNVVGISTLTQTYQPALEICKITKKYNGITLLGNDHASLRAELIMNKQTNLIDYISTSEFGELIICNFLDYIDGNININDIPGLYYRDKNNKYNILKSNASEKKIKCKSGMDLLGIPDRKLLPPEAWEHYKLHYINNYGKLHSKNNQVTGIRVYFSKF